MSFFSHVLWSNTCNPDYSFPWLLESSYIRLQVDSEGFVLRDEGPVAMLC